MFNIVGALYLIAKRCHLCMTPCPRDLKRLWSMLFWMRISRHNIINTTVLVLLRLDHIIIMAFFFLTFFHFVSQLPTCLYFISKFISFQVSPNNKLVAYAEDTKGDEIYTVYVIDAETQAPIGEPLVGVTSYLGWAGDDALVYITMDNILRPDKVGNSPLDQVFNCFVLISAFLFNNNNNHQSFHDFTKILFWSTFRSNY